MRPVAAALAALLLAGCSSHTEHSASRSAPPPRVAHTAKGTAIPTTAPPTGVAQPTASPSPFAHPTFAARRVSPCSGSALRVSLVDAGAGQGAFRVFFTFVNVGKSACALSGDYTARGYEGSRMVFSTTGPITAMASREPLLLQAGGSWNIYIVTMSTDAIGPNYCVPYNIAEIISPDGISTGRLGYQVGDHSDYCKSGAALMTVSVAGNVY